jgi:ABC-2 type transport system permease protein
VAGVVSVPGQFRAVAQMRWRMFLNSLRTRRGGLELGARVLMQGFYAFIGIGFGFGLGFAAWQMAVHNHFRALAALLWTILIFWQMVPIMIASFQETADLSIFLRFPVTFSSYLLLYILSGLFDVGTLVGGIGLLGIWIGTSFARPGVILWITFALGLFAVFNILLTRMIFVWIDRWLAQRKTREILGVVFLFLMLAVQLLNPALHEGNRSHHAITTFSILRYARTAGRAQRFLPPGLAANALAAVSRDRPVAAGTDLLILAIYAAAAGSVLGIRLRAEYRGESLGQAPRAVDNARARRRQNRFEGSGPVAAVIEKEIRYIMRSGVMLYGFLAPLVIVFLFSGTGSGFGGKFALPIGVAYSFLGLTRFIYNNLGGEGAGIQIYFLSPTPIREVMLAKNIVHTLIFLIELVFVCIIVAFRTGMPGPQILLITFCWLLFAVPAQLAIGNVLSITMPYRMAHVRMVREQGAAGNNFLSLLVELLVFVVGAAVYLPLQAIGHPALAVPILLGFAVVAIVFWLRVLANSGAMVQARRESLFASLYRAA